MNQNSATIPSSEPDEVVSVRVSPEVKKRVACWQNHAGLPSLGDAFRVVIDLGLRRMDGRKIANHENPLMS
jgi:hypothetical protein